MNLSKSSFSKKNVEKLSAIDELYFEQKWYQTINDNHFWIQWRFKVLKRQLKDLKIDICYRTQKILEVGGGHGILRQQLEHYTSIPVDLCDLNFHALKLCPPSLGRTFYYNILDRNNKLREAYDTIILFDVLEHIANPYPFVKSLAWHLKPGGFLLINVPALPSFYSAFDSILGHQRRYNRNMVADHLGSNGFDLIDVRYWGISLIPLLLGRWLYMQRIPKDEKIRSSWASKGVTPPHSLMHSILLSIMHIENKIMHRPPVGTSLMCVAKKILS